MNKSLAEKARLSRLRKEIAQNDAQTRRLQSVKNEYDVVKGNNSRLRRVPSPEYQNEEGILTGYKHGQAVAMGRDLQRNFSSVASALNQFSLNVVGKGPKIRLKSKSDPEQAKRLATWFNSEWSKQSDFRDDLNFGEQVGLLITALKREGDALLVFDDFGLVPGESASGKCLWYESDQFCELDNLKLAPEPWRNMQQSRGVLMDKWGRRRGYAVSSINGRTTLPYNDPSVTIFPAAVARHIKRVWRFNQVRGVPALLTIAADMQDAYELQSGEVQTGKVQSKLAGTISKTPEALAAIANQQMGDTSTRSTTDVTYRRLEALAGGAIEYLEHDDQFNLLDWKRPALNFVESLDQLARKSFSALGLSQTYSLLRVTSSYTAFRGEMLLAWAQFYADQKMLERHCCDWTAERALAWGVASGAITGAIPEDLSMSWAWPRMPAVDPLHEAQAVELLIKTLQSNYSEQLGPEWEETHEQLARETKADKTMGLPTVWEAEKQGLRFDGKTGAISPQSDNGSEKSNADAETGDEENEDEDS